MGMGRAQHAVLDKEEVGCVGFGKESAVVQHDRVIRTCVVGLDFGQNVVQEVVVVDFGVQERRSIAPDGARDERQLS